MELLWEINRAVHFGINTELLLVISFIYCPVRVLKCAKNILSSPLAELINRCVQTGKNPSKLKHAKIIPVYKGDDETDPSNYRPISLLSVFNRIFEKTMYNRLKSYIEDNELLYKAQYGFREIFSTQHAILDITIQYDTNKYGQENVYMRRFPRF